MSTKAKHRILATFVEGGQVTEVPKKPGEILESVRKEFGVDYSENKGYMYMRALVDDGLLRVQLDTGCELFTPTKDEHRDRYDGHQAALEADAIRNKLRCAPPFSEALPATEIRTGRETTTEELAAAGIPPVRPATTRNPHKGGHAMHYLNVASRQGGFTPEFN